MEAKSQQNFYKKAAIVVISSKLSLWSIHSWAVVNETNHTYPNFVAKIQEYMSNKTQNST